MKIAGIEPLSNGHITPSALAKQLGVAPKTILQLVKNGVLPSWRFNRRNYIAKADAEAWLASTKNPMTTQVS